MSAEIKDMRSAPPHAERAALLEEALSEGAPYRFRYALLSVLVDVQQGHLIIKTSTKTQLVPLHALRSFYAPLARHATERELVLAYEGPRGLKRARLFAQRGEPAFERLLLTLQARLPEGDLSHLPAHEAYAQLGSQERPWVAIPLVMLIGTALMAALASPLLLHGLEGAPYELSWRALERGELSVHQLPSAHLRVEGKLRVAQLAQGNSAQSRRAQDRRAQGSFDVLAPLDPLPSASQGAADVLSLPPKLIVKQTIKGGLDLQALSAQRSFQGLTRNIGWEGLSVQERQALSEAGVDLSASPVLLELQASPSADLTLYLTLVGALLTLTSLVWLALKPKGPQAKA